MRLAIDEKPAMRNGLDDGAQTDCVEGREIGGRHNRWMGCSVGRARCVQLFSFFFRNLGKIDQKIRMSADAEVLPISFRKERGRFSPYGSDRDKTRG